MQRKSNGNGHGVQQLWLQLEAPAETAVGAGVWRGAGEKGFAEVLVVGSVPDVAEGALGGIAEGETAVAALSAEALYKQYQDDENKANKNYLGKVLEVTGILSQVMHSGANEIWILSAASQGGINCQMFFDKNDIPPDPKPGDKIVLKGKCTGFLMDVNLTDCVAEK